VESHQRPVRREGRDRRQVRSAARLRDESRLALQQYVCDQANSCGWRGDQRGLQPSRPAYTDPMRRYFGRSAQAIPNTTSHHLRRRQQLGDLCAPAKVCWSRPPTPWWGTLTGPPSTTSPALCSATVDNSNRGQRLLRRRRTAACLFDGLLRRPSGARATPFPSGTRLTEHCELHVVRRRGRQGEAGHRVRGARYR